MRKPVSAIRASALLILFTVILVSEAQAATISGRWLTEGGGFAERGILRIALTADGHVDILSSTSGRIETLTGYNVYCILRATKAEFNAWSYTGSLRLPNPITITDYNPTLNDPLYLPSFTVDDLTYTITLKTTESGTVKIRGYTNIDGVGRCEVNADCAIWKQGSPKPDIPNTESGCDAGIGSLAALCAAAGVLAALTRRNG